MSASAMATSSFMRSSFSAITKSCGAVKLAATVCPGSIERVSTMPSMGDLMTAFDKSFSLMRTCAWACPTRDCALRRSAEARSDAAIAVAISACEGIFPPLKRDNSRCRANAAKLSFTVACACVTLASATFTAARLLSVCCNNFVVSSFASACPLLT